MASRESTANGTQYPIYHEGQEDIHEDESVRVRYFTNETKKGLEAGAAISVMLTIEKQAREVWPYFKDFNLWQNEYGHYYSGAVGDLEGRTFALGPKENLGAHRYRVIRAIPEHLIVIAQPVPQDGSTGGVSPGFHVFTLNEHGGRTIITGYMQHSTRTVGKSAEEALAYWRDEKMAPEWHRKWRDVFIPALKKLVSDGTRGNV